MTILPMDVVTLALTEQRNPTNRFACITINQFVSEKGTAVMGRGNARAMADAIPGLQSRLGAGLLAMQKANRCNQILVAEDLRLIGFPVKPESIIVAHDRSNIVHHMRWKWEPGTRAPGWAAKADPNIINAAIVSLYSWTERTGNEAYLPVPGCGAGELNFEADVLPVISRYVNNRIHLVSLP